MDVHRAADLSARSLLAILEAASKPGNDVWLTVPSGIGISSRPSSQPSSSFPLSGTCHE